MSETQNTTPPNDLVYLTDREYFKRQRPEQLVRKIPDIWSHSSVLYVGARTDRMDFGICFQMAGYDIDVLEVFGPNVEYLKQIQWIKKVIQGDVRHAPMIVDRDYDVVFWWHGPEHIEKVDLERTLEGLKRITKKIVVCGSPWGIYEQGPLYDNPWEIHRSTLYPSDFESLEFKTSTLGIQDLPKSNILSWWRREGIVNKTLQVIR